MSKFEEFQKAFVKAAKAAPNIAESRADSMVINIGKTEDTISAGFDQLAEDLMNARKAGVSGKTLKDYLDDGAVKATVASLKKMLADNYNRACDALEARAALLKAVAEHEKLSKDVEDAMKPRKLDVFKSAKEKEANLKKLKDLKKTVDDKLAEMNRVVLKFRNIAAANNYDPIKEFTRLSDKALKLSDGAIKGKADDQKATRDLDIRRLRTGLSGFAADLKKISTATGQAIAFANARDLQSGLKQLKVANDLADDMDKTTNGLLGSYKKFKDGMDAGDKKEIKELLVKYQKAVAAARKQVSDCGADMKAATGKGKEKRD